MIDKSKNILCVINIILYKLYSRSKLIINKNDHDLISSVIVSIPVDSNNSSNSVTIVLSHPKPIFLDIPYGCVFVSKITFRYSTNI